MAMEPSEGTQEDFRGQSQWVFNRISVSFCASHRDDNQLTSQCFKLSSLQKQRIDEET